MFNRFRVWRALKALNKKEKLDIRPALRRDSKVRTERPVLNLMEGMIEKPGGKQ